VAQAGVEVVREMRPLLMTDVLHWWTRRGRAASFQPMNINFSLFPSLDAPTRGSDGKKLKGAAVQPAPLTGCNNGVQCCTAA
jgi:folate-dependent tRNA-U54 methylase TrmFO/GidA